MRRRRGVTLTELLLAATLTAIVLVPVLGIFGFVDRQWRWQSTRSENILAANLGMELMSKEIGSAVSYVSSDGTVTDIFILPAHKDAAGNYVPTWLAGILAYQPGTQVRFYRSDTTGNRATVGTILWREYKPVGGVWTKDSAWSLLPGSSPARGRVEGVDSLSFSTLSMPANTIEITLKFKTKVQGNATLHTVKQLVYLSNHN